MQFLWGGGLSGPPRLPGLKGLPGLPGPPRWQGSMGSEWREWREWRERPVARVSVVDTSQMLQAISIQIIKSSLSGLVA